MVAANSSAVGCMSPAGMIFERENTNSLHENKKAFSPFYCKNYFR